MHHTKALQMTRFAPNRLARINAWMDGYVEAGKLAGSSLLLASGGKIAHRYRTGLQSVEEATPFQDDTIVRIYSMTKPLASVAMMMLVERGLIHLDAPVSSVLPEFTDMTALVPGAERLDQVEPCAAPTIHQLLVHTSGLTYPFNPGPLAEPYFEQKLNFAPDAPGLEATVKALAKLPLCFQPGARWNYSNGIDVIGRVIEVVSGQPFDKFMKKEVLGPLNMNETGFVVRDDQLDRFAHLYTSMPEGGGLTLSAAADEVILRRTDNAENSPYRTTKTMSGGGGLVGTIDDYFRFCEMLRRGGDLDGVRILSPATLEFMRRNHLPGDIASMGATSFAEQPMEGVGFGLGWSIMLEPALAKTPGSVGDLSWGGIASTFFWIDPLRDITCIFFTQLAPSSSYPLRPQLKALVHGAMV